MPTSKNSGARAAKQSQPHSRLASGGHPTSSHGAAGRKTAAIGWLLGGATVLGLGLLGWNGLRSEMPERTPVSTISTVQVAPAKAAFKGERAFANLQRQVGFGPRVPGTPGHRQCRDFLTKTLSGLADRVTRQDFSRTVRGNRLEMTNIVARWNGTNPAAKSKGVLLCAHWDTRPTADYEQSPSRRSQPIPGANDGASGVAVLLEIARQLKQNPPAVPVMMVLFDGEDFGPSVGDMFFGSRYFANNLPSDVPRRGILLDMVGDRDLVIPKEAYSVQNARDVVSEVYGIARRLGYTREFPDRQGGPIEDDHVPLQNKGLKVIDLIDFDYGPGHSWWHTLEDTPDKCSPKSLQAVGDVVLEWVRTQAR